MASNVVPMVAAISAVIAKRVMYVSPGPAALRSVTDLSVAMTVAATSAVSVPVSRMFARKACVSASRIATERSAARMVAKVAAVYVR